MAIYHLSIKIVSRGKGKSAVAAAAYRSGERLTNEYDGLTHDYTRKVGIAHTQILLPDHAPREYADRATLWNAVERIEKNKNSQLSREVELALPVELSAGQNISLVREYCNRHFVEKGMCADICIHDKNDGNPHAHIMLTMRPFESDGSWGAKSKKEYILDGKGERIILKSGEYKSRKVDAVDWNNQDNAEIWRDAWANICNQYLERNNATERIDHRSYERQGILQIPTIHLGTSAFQMEKRGIRTERGDINREIEITNSQLRQLKARINKLQVWLNEEMENTEPPTLADVISNILTWREQVGQPSRYSSIKSLKAAANLLDFLQTNNIMDMAGLDEKLKSMIAKQSVIRDELKPIERRLKTLDEHMRHSENFKDYRSFKRQYDELYSRYETAQKVKGFGVGRKAQKALDAANEYYETYRSQITLYEAAERYLKDVLQGHFDANKLPPVTKWKAERDKLYIEKNRLNLEYVSLRHETAEAEKIRSSIYNIMREENHRAQPKRERDMERQN